MAYCRQCPKRRPIFKCRPATLLLQATAKRRNESLNFSHGCECLHLEDYPMSKFLPSSDGKFDLFANNFVATLKADPEKSIRLLKPLMN